MELDQQLANLPLSYKTILQKPAKRLHGCNVIVVTLPFVHVLDMKSKGAHQSNYWPACGLHIPAAPLAPAPPPDNFASFPAYSESPSLSPNCSNSVTFLKKLSGRNLPLSPVPSGRTSPSPPPRRHFHQAQP